MSLKRNLKTEKSRKFWEGVERIAARVDKWPAWMKGILEEENSEDIEKSSNQVRENNV